MLTKFCILSSARTGSSYLMSALNQVPQIVCQSEVYHSKCIYTLKGTDVSQLGSIEERNSHPVEFLNRLLEVTMPAFTGRTIFGFKLFDDHNRTVWDHIFTSDGYRKVFLYRENKLAQFSSWLIAMQTNEWNVRAKKEKKSVKVTFPVEQFKRYLRHRSAVEEKIFKAVDGDPRLFFAFEYRDIGNPERLSALLDFLGAGYEGRVQGTFQKQNSSDIVSRFVNPEDVIHELRVLGKEHWVQE